MLASPPPILASPPELTEGLARLATLQRRAATAAARSAGLTAAEHGLLAELLIAEPLAPTRLAAWLGLTTGGLTAVLHRLEQRGLIERHAHQRDRRSRLVALSPAGREVAVAAQEASLAALRPLLANLGAADRAALARFLGAAAPASR